MVLFVRLNTNGFGRQFSRNGFQEEVAKDFVTPRIQHRGTDLQFSGTVRALRGLVQDRPAHQKCQRLVLLQSHNIYFFGRLAYLHTYIPVVYTDNDGHR
jgi:hypothetical protein